MTTREQFIKLSQSQVGVKEEGNTNRVKYSKYFDTPTQEGGAWQWLNGKKNGIAAWCSIYLCWLVCQILGNKEALSFLGCPAPKNNCAAGVPYLWKYLKAKGYVVDKSKGVAGDIIFFNSNKHVGMIEKVENGKYHTIEGNKGNAVKRSSYSISSKSVCGIAHLPFEKYDTVEPTPSPEPTPTPAPTPEVKKYVVNVKTALNIRKGPSMKYAVVGTLNRGAVVTVIATENGWGKIGNSKWVFMKYLVAFKEDTSTNKDSTPNSYKVTAKSGLNVRQGPGTNYKIVAVLKYNTSVKVYETRNEWSRIGNNRWCSNKYLK